MQQMELTMLAIDAAKTQINTQVDKLTGGAAKSTRRTTR